LQNQIQARNDANLWPIVKKKQGKKKQRLDKEASDAAIALKKAEFDAEMELLAIHKWSV
jgi:hypothetical protein